MLHRFLQWIAFFFAATLFIIQPNDAQAQSAPRNRPVQVSSPNASSTQARRRSRRRRRASARRLRRTRGWREENTNTPRYRRNRRSRRGFTPAVPLGVEFRLGVNAGVLNGDLVTFEHRRSNARLSADTMLELAGETVLAMRIHQATIGVGTTFGGLIFSDSQAPLLRQDAPWEPNSEIGASYSGTVYGNVGWIPAFGDAFELWLGARIGIQTIRAWVHAEGRNYMTINRDELIWGPELGFRYGDGPVRLDIRYFLDVQTHYSSTLSIGVTFSSQPLLFLE